ncbi:MAG: hypothetical protein WBD40_18500 [Tepidisphaeraceae bacterium]
MCVVAAALFVSPARAHDPLLDLPEPRSVPESWNVINASVANVATLLENNQLREVAFQIANCSPAIRTLQANLPADDAARERRAELQAMFSPGSAIILATREKDEPARKARALFPAYRESWERIGRHYDERERSAAVFVCPMHPLDRHLEKDARCTACGMALLRRRIPPSPVYEKPGAPSMTLRAIPDAPLTPGQPARVTVRLARIDGSPVRDATDLIVMHTQRVHLLIVDRSLLDYHHEHPTPTQTPGEYTFTFTPRRPGPYRVWADVVPVASAVQEFVVADIPGQGDGEELADRETRLSDVVDGLRYELKLDTKGQPLRVGEEVLGRVTVTDRDGKPFNQLEPVMGAFAHLVGFVEDYRTVVHLHPLGIEPTIPTHRGGPTIIFRYYPSKPGFVRFYCQVNVNDSAKFARFGVTVEPAKPASR